MKRALGQVFAFKTYLRGLGSFRQRIFYIFLSLVCAVRSVQEALFYLGVFNARWCTLQYNFVHLFRLIRANHIFTIGNIFLVLFYLQRIYFLSDTSPKLTRLLSIAARLYHGQDDAEVRRFLSTSADHATPPPCSDSSRRMAASIRRAVRAYLRICLGFVLVNGKVVVVVVIEFH